MRLKLFEKIDFTDTGKRYLDDGIEYPIEATISSGIVDLPIGYIKEYRIGVSLGYNVQISEHEMSVGNIDIEKQALDRVTHGIADAVYGQLRPHLHEIYNNPDDREKVRYLAKQLLDLTYGLEVNDE